MDAQTAFCINGRGSNCPKDEKPISTLQNCFIYFENKLDFDSIKTKIAKEFFPYKRLSSISVLPAGSPVWETKFRSIEITQEVQDRMIVKHIVNNDDELYDLIDTIGNQHLPRDLPQWKFHYIENNKGLSAWVWRVSHGLADGLRLVPLAANLFQDIDGQVAGVPSIGKLNSKQPQRRGARKNRINWMNPKTYYRLFQDMYKVWYSINGDCDTLNAFKPDNKIHGPKVQIHVRNKTPFKIDDIKALKNKYNVSFNDVITALTCSGIRSYILSKDPDYFKRNKKPTMTAMLAFGFPPKEEFLGQRDWLRNGFGLVDWEFPIYIEDFVQRLRIINRNGKKLKTSFVSPLGLKGTEMLARLGLDDILDENFTKLFARHTCVFSSLPSWNKQLYFEGVKVTKMEASYLNWIPQFIFISYNQYIYGTLVVDPNRYPNAQLILDAMNEELLRQAR